jgi:hypothetical protein
MLALGMADSQTGFSPKLPSWLATLAEFGNGSVTLLF